MNLFNPQTIPLTKYLFYTGKGGVGKTSTACATATDEALQAQYDHILFDTAPTGHTLRMLQLPSAWSNFISNNTHGASCLGQLSGLESKKAMYKQAVATLADGRQTTLILVSRPESAPLKEAARAAQELADLGVTNQVLVVNGVLASYDDRISESLYRKQQQALGALPPVLAGLTTYHIPLRAYNITGIDNVRAFLTQDQATLSDEVLLPQSIPKLSDVVDDLYRSHKKVVFTMGKGGGGHCARPCC